MSLIIKNYKLIILLLTIINPVNANIIKSIEITGLNSVSRGVVLNYIPVEKGDTISNNTSNIIIRTLYKTKLFDDISVLEENGVVKIHLKEKPHIYSIDISGYSDAIIEKEQLNKILKSTKLSEGEVFNEKTLNNFIKQLHSRYKQQGYYSAKISKNIDIDNQNRVTISVDIEENNILLVRSMKIIGSSIYTESELLDEFEIGTADFFIINYFTEKDQYSRNKLNAGIENVKKLYINSGYINFKVSKLTTKISKNKKYIDIDIGITEGGKYKIGKIFFTGDTLYYSKSDVKKQITLKTNDTFKHKDLLKSTEAIAKFYTDRGYAFIKVDAKNKLNTSSKIVDIEFPITLNQKVYVNRIIIQGNLLTQDEVVRREIKQLESSLYSSKNIDDSVTNIKKLGYFSDVKVQIEKIANSNNKLNIIFVLTETKTGNFTVGISHSNSSGISANLGVSEKNFLGGGNTFNFNIAYSKSVQNYSFSFIDPYFTDNRNSINYGLSYNKLDAANLDVSNYQINTKSGHIGYGIPLGEYTNLVTTLNVANHDITCGATFATLEQLQCSSNDSNEIKINTSWSQNTLNNYRNPTKGVHALASFDLSLPIGDFKYYKIDIKHDIYVPFIKNIVLKANNNIGIAQSYGDGYLPFFKRYYGGGGNSIRGFEFNTLGEEYPETQKAKGGEVSFISSISAISPVPFLEDNKNIRISAFIDAGSVYDKISSAKIDDIRVSTGIALSWFTPIGPLGIVYAVPLHKKDNDQVKKFDFTLGSTF